MATEPPIAIAGADESAQTSQGAGEPAGPHVPDPGAFGWSVRAFAPGLDVSAVRAAAIRHGYLTAAGGPGPNDPIGPIAEFMDRAFATAYDRVVAYRLGLTTDAGVPDVEALLAFGYAFCVLTAQAGVFNPDFATEVPR